MAHDAPEQELDEDGLAVRKYDSQVLVVLPKKGFGDQILRYTRSSLYNVHVGTWSTSSAEGGLVVGRLQDEFVVDQSLSEVTLEAYSGIVVAGNEGDCELAQDAKILDLVREADRAGKLIGTWGNALAVLVRAGVVRGRRVTGDGSLREEVSKAGGRYTGREIEVSKNLVTARDEGAGMRFGQALVEAVRI